MAVIITVLIIIAAGCAGFLLFALLAGAAVTTSAFDQAIDDWEQEKWIREYMKEKERKVKKKKAQRGKLHK